MNDSYILENPKLHDKGATIRLPGGGLGFFWKKYSGPGFGKKKNSGLDHVWKKYLGSIHWTKIVCPLSMKRKCLPSIHEKKMSALYIHENKMLALYKWYYHGSRTNLIFVSLSWSWWMSAAKLERHWTVIKLLGRIIFQLYINLIKVQSLLIPVWTCMHVLEGPQIKDPFIFNWENNKIEKYELNNWIMSSTCSM